MNAATLLTVVEQGGAPFSPLSVSGLVAWYDFSDAATLFTDSARTTAVTADGDAIGGVTDKSGAGNHLSQSLTLRPLYKIGIKNGRAAALFDGVNDILLATGLGWATLTTAHTIFIVSKHLSAAGGWAWMISSQNFIPGARIGKRTGVTGLRWDFAGQAAALDVNVDLTAFNVLEAKWTGSARTIYYNAASSGTDTMTQSGNPGYVVLGARGDGAEYWNGYILETIIYSAALSDANRALVESYLNSKWAVY